MGRTGRGDSLRALAAANDAGITFFDTARSYGYGESETLLGEFLRGRRHSTVLCTKFGILPMSNRGWKQRIKPLARTAVRFFPALRKYARRQAAGQFHAGQFSLEVLQTSFETSLRELKTDYVDMLLLHAATLDVLDRDDLFAAMERLIESGKVRIAGISAELSVMAETFHRRPTVLTTAQFAMNQTNLHFVRETVRPQAQEMFLVGNHPFGGTAGVEATATRIDALRSSITLPASLREKFGARDSQLMPEILLNIILQGTGISAIVPTMMRLKNLRKNVLAIERCRFTPQELDLLRIELTREI
jgi:aryl-alcohol dehydrogenase-like predicted oxidoreductase